MRDNVRPEALLTSIGWFWLVNAGTILFLLLAMLLTYPLYAGWLAEWLAASPLPGTGLLRWIGQHLVALLVAHSLLSVYALAPSLALFRYRAWARRQLVILSWLSVAYTLALGGLYFHFWFSLLAAAGSGALPLSPVLFYALIIGIGIGLVLMIGLPFAIVAHFLQRADVRQATG